MSYPTCHIQAQSRPLEDDGRPDIQTYNSELRELGGVTWLAVPWLYAECYMYRCG